MGRVCGLLQQGGEGQPAARVFFALQTVFLLLAEATKKEADIVKEKVYGAFSQWTKTQSQLSEVHLAHQLVKLRNSTTQSYRSMKEDLTREKKKAFSLPATKPDDILLKFTCLSQTHPLYESISPRLILPEVNSL